MSDKPPSTTVNAAVTAPADRLAERLGFASYLDLFEGSTPLAYVGQKAWMMTRLPSGEWAVWNDRDLEVEARYATQDEALTSKGSG